MSPADEAWVKELYEANALKLYKVAFRRLGDKDEAENVVQEAFLLLLARFDTVRVHPNPSGWLMKVVQNLIRHSMDRNQKQSSHEISIEEQITQISAPPKQFFSLRDILPPGLTQREQDLLVWFYEEGLSYEEISARLKIPILTCRTQMFRAKQHYKKLAEKETEPAWMSAVELFNGILGPVYPGLLLRPHGFTAVRKICQKPIPHFRASTTIGQVIAL